MRRARQADQRRTGNRHARSQRALYLHCGSARPDSNFEIGSITKSLTGLVLTRQMVVQERVSLNEPVRALLPLRRLLPLRFTEGICLNQACGFRNPIMKFEVAHRAGRRESVGWWMALNSLGLASLLRNNERRFRPFIRPGKNGCAHNVINRTDVQTGL